MPDVDDFETQVREMLTHHADDAPNPGPAIKRLTGAGLGSSADVGDRNWRRWVLPLAAACVVLAIVGTVAATQGLPTGSGHKSTSVAAPSANAPTFSTPTPTPTPSPGAPTRARLVPPDTTSTQIARPFCSSWPTTTVTITINPDTPQPGCVTVSRTQRLRVVNNTNGYHQPGEQITTRFARFAPRVLAIGASTTYSAGFGSYLAAGQHYLRVSAYGGTNIIIWLKPTPPPSATAPTSRAAPCTDSAVTVTGDKFHPSASGERANVYAVTNIGSTACTLSGYPAVTMTSGGRSVPFRYVTSAGRRQYTTGRPPGLVTLRPGDSGYITVAKYRCDVRASAVADSIHLRMPGQHVVHTLPVGNMEFCAQSAATPGDLVELSPIEPTIARTV